MNYKNILFYLDGTQDPVEGITNSVMYALGNADITDASSTIMIGDRCYDI